jgi:hypothetical protein
MIRYLLDTDIASFFLKNHDPALVVRVRAALRANHVAISAVTRAELRYGQALLPPDATRRSALIDTCLAVMPVLELRCACRRLPWHPHRGPAPPRAADRVHGHQDLRSRTRRGTDPGDQQYE